MRKFLFSILIIIVSAGPLYAHQDILQANLISRNYEQLYQWRVRESVEFAESMLPEGGKDPNIIFLAAMSYFYRSDYDSSLFYMDKLRQYDWENFDYWHDIVKETYDLTKNFTKYESDHFTLALDAGQDAVLSGYLLMALEKAYVNVGRDLGFYPDFKIMVEIYPDTQSFQTASTLTVKQMETSGAVGICKFSRIMMISPVNFVRGFSYLDTITHEYVHFCVNYISKAYCDLWLHEGTARFEERKWRDGEYALDEADRGFLSDNIRNDTFISFKRMYPSLVNLSNGEEVKLAFIQVALAVRYIIENYGRDGFYSFFDRIGYFQDTNRAFEEVFKSTVPDFEAKLKSYIKSAYSGGGDGGLFDRDEFKLKEQGRSLTDIELDWLKGDEIRHSIRLGDMFRDRNKLPAAVFEYKKALDSDPNSVVILNKLAKALTMERNDTEALPYLLKARDIKKGYPATHTNLGNLYLMRRDFDSALASFYEAIYINPYDPDIHFKLSLIYLNRGDMVSAGKEINNALLLAPDNPYYQSVKQKIK